MVADWSNHCPRTVGTLHHLRLPRTKGLGVPLWFSTLCHFTSLTAPTLSFLQGLLKVGFRLLLCSSNCFMWSSCILRSCSVWCLLISSRMRPRRPPVNPPNRATSLLAALVGAPRPDARCARLSSSQVSLAD